MKKMMTGRKISTSEDVYSHSTHTLILHAIPHSHSFAFVCKPTFFLPECNKAGLLFASGCNSWYFDFVQQSFLFYILKYKLNFQFIIELKDRILNRIILIQNHFLLVLSIMKYFTVSRKSTNLGSKWCLKCSKYINLPRRKTYVVVQIIFPFRLFYNNFCFKGTKEPQLGRVPRPIVLALISFRSYYDVIFQAHNAVLNIITDTQQAQV